MTEEHIPPPSIEGLSERTQRLLVASLKEVNGVEEDSLSEVMEDALESLKTDLDGQALSLLEESLDWLRDAGLYLISVPLLEEAWSTELPLDFLGRVAQDWVGSVLFGLGDERGAREVALHLEKRALELGPSLCSDLCDLWIEWGLFERAVPLALAAHEQQPGEDRSIFHLMICAKMNGNWEEANKWLTCLDQHRVNPDAPRDPAVEWNRGLIAVVNRNWPEARHAWKHVGFSFPVEEKGEEEDYATAGELSPVRLKMTLDEVEASGGKLPKSEVVWGRRIGPARIELSGLPYFHPRFRCGDILLVDGVREGQVDFNGQSYPVVPALETWAPSPGETLRFYGRQTMVQHVIALDELAQRLGEAGWPIANWTRLVRRESAEGEPLLQLGLYVSPERNLLDFKEAIDALIGEGRLPQLFCSRYAELVGEDPKVHKEALKALGLSNPTS